MYGYATEASAVIDGPRGRTGNSPTPFHLSIKQHHQARSALQPGKVVSLSERGHGINEVPDEWSPCWDHLCSIVKQANDDLQVMLGSGFLAHPISQKSL